MPATCITQDTSLLTYSEMGSETKLKLARRRLGPMVEYWCVFSKLASNVRLNRRQAGGKRHWGCMYVCSGLCSRLCCNPVIGVRQPDECWPREMTQADLRIHIPAISVLTLCTLPFESTGWMAGREVMVGGRAAGQFRGWVGRSKLL